MSFVPTNSSGFYSDMMKNFKEKWDMLFIEALSKIINFINEQVTVTKTDEVFVGNKNIIPGSRTIIYYILLF